MLGKDGNMFSRQLFVSRNARHILPATSLRKYGIEVGIVDVYRGIGFSRRIAKHAAYLLE